MGREALVSVSHDPYILWMKGQGAAKQKAVRDGFLRERFVLPREAARAVAREWLERWPTEAYWTSVESWHEEPGDRIAFTLRRLPAAD